MHCLENGMETPSPELPPLAPYDPPAPAPEPPAPAPQAAAWRRALKVIASEACRTGSGRGASGRP